MDNDLGLGYFTDMLGFVYHPLGKQCTQWLPRDSSQGSKGWTDSAPSAAGVENEQNIEAPHQKLLEILKSILFVALRAVDFDTFSSWHRQ
jgi:hypothetical protein